MFLSTVLRNGRLGQNGSTLIGLLGLQGIKTQEMSAWLLRSVQDGSSYSDAESAALVLGQMSPLPPELLPALVTLLGDKRNFANENLLKLIQRYGDDAKPYVQELKELKAKLDREVSLHPSERSVDISDDGWTAKVFSQLIAELEESKADR